MTDPVPEPRVLDRGVARKQAFLHAAREVFLEHGYEAASVNEVVRRAGGSLATLYSQYGSKEGLFQAVARDQQERFMTQLAPLDYTGLPLEDGLRRLGERFLDVVLHPDNLAFFRIAVGEGRNRPHLLRRYLSISHDKVREALIEYMRSKPAQNGARVLDPESAAAHFFHIVRGGLHYKSVYDSEFVLSPEERHAHVADSVRFFLNGALER